MERQGGRVMVWCKLESEKVKQIKCQNSHIWMTLLTDAQKLYLDQCIGMECGVPVQTPCPGNEIANPLSYPEPQ